jgi:cell division protein FtsZ
MNDEMRVTVVATGLGRTSRRPTLVPPISVPVLKTGTYDLTSAPASPMATETAPSGAPAGHDYAGYDQPAIWRQPPRSEAAARVLALEEGGMDRLDIPAFLRRQAD